MAMLSSYTSKRNHNKQFLFIASVLLSVFFAYVFITDYLFAVYKVQSENMQPEFDKGDLIVVNYFYNPALSAKRGDIVLVTPTRRKLGVLKKLTDAVVGFISFNFYHPFGFENAAATKFYMRRLVGKPGDTVYMDGFILHVKTKDGEHFLSEFELTAEDYNIWIDNLPDGWASGMPFSGSMPKITLKENEYFVLCDNRIITADSRLLGPIKGDSQIAGKVLFRYWPLSKIKKF